MSRRVLLVVAERGFRDDELAAARHELAGLGLDTRVASPPGARLHGQLGADKRLDLHLGDVGPEAFDAIVVIGGPGAIEELWGNRWLIDLLRGAFEAHKLIAGIGLGVVPIAQAGLLHGAHATVYPADRAIEELERHGARRVPGDLVDDGTGIVTARGPEAAADLARRVAARLEADETTWPGGGR